MSRWCRIGWLAPFVALGFGCSRSSVPAPATPTTIESAEWEPPEKLADYHLFAGDGRSQEPLPGVIPYDLVSALFSDYAAKYRFIKLPEGKSASYQEYEAFDFPVGTIIAKTFAFPHDVRDLSKGQRLIETRLLIHRPEGWTGLPYTWNASQNEATLDLAGGTADVEWIDAAGKRRTNNYIIPNANQCKSCHENDRKMMPIGPKARHLNRDFAYATGPENQLAHWTRVGALIGAPAPEKAPKNPVWNDPRTGSLDQRARAWLEINCAHCHNAKGPARTSGLELDIAVREPVKWGLMKTPVAAGRGSGGRLFDIVPGKPDESILMYRIESTDPGVMMPELPRRLVDSEANALIRDWIAHLSEKG